jgi:thiol-disulfide isomerase/thioredoxin
MKILTIVSVCLTLLHVALASEHQPELGSVFDLTDINFDHHVNSSASSPPWLIELYAPWCPACKDLEPMWQQLAADLGPSGLLLGKVRNYLYNLLILFQAAVKTKKGFFFFSLAQIDGTKNRALMTRFSIRHFPTIFYITGAETREYTGRHTLQDLSAFAMGNWKNVEPRTGCASPVSRCGRIYGEIGKLPARGKAKYFELRDQKKYSDVSLFAGMLAVPVVFGLALIAALDFYYSRRPFPHHLHQH